MIKSARPLQLALSCGLAIAAVAAVSAGRADAAVVAHFDFQAGGDGDELFEDVDGGLFSVDTEPVTSATRLDSTTADGGGASNIFNGSHTGSASGPPLANWGNGHLSEASAAFVSFTVTPAPGFLVNYDSLSLYHASFDASGSFKITYAIGAGPDVEALSPTPHTATNDDDLTFLSHDFADFVTSETVTWKIHIFGASGDNVGHRFDDIIFNASVAVPEPGSGMLLGLAMLATGRRFRRKGPRTGVRR